MASLRSFLVSATIVATAGWRRSFAKGSKAFLASEADLDLRPDLVANTFATLANEWRSQARVFAECNASVDSNIVDEATPLAPCSAGPRSFEKSCSTVVGALLKSSDGEPSVVREYMDNVCEEPKLKGWKSTGCRDFSRAVLDAMSADVLNNRERLSARPVCHSFWLKFLAQESQLLKQERAEREEELRQKDATRAEEMKQVAEEAGKKAEEQARAEEDRRRKEEEDRREAEKKRVAEEEAARKTAKEAEATKARHLMEEARALANASAVATWAPENTTVSSPQEVLSASAEALAVSGSVPSQGETTPMAANATDDLLGNVTSQERVAPAAANVTDDLFSNVTSQEQVAFAAANATDGLSGNATNRERVVPAVAANATDGPSGHAASVRADDGNSTVPGNATANKTS